MALSHSVDINAPAEKVFYWLEDSQRCMQWLDGVVENEDLEIKEGVVGSTCRQVYEENGKRMEGFGKTTEYEKNKRLRVWIDYKMFELDVLYTLEENNGVTTLTQTADTKFNGFFMKIMGWVMCKLMPNSGKKCLDKSFAKLKELCEKE